MHDGRVRRRSAPGAAARPTAVRTLAAAPHRRKCRTARVSQRIEPTGVRCQCFLPLGLAGYLKRHAAAFDVAHLHACRNLPGVIAARHLQGQRGFRTSWPPTARPRTSSGVAPPSVCSMQSLGRGC